MRRVGHPARPPEDTLPGLLRSKTRLFPEGRACEAGSSKGVVTSRRRLRGRDRRGSGRSYAAAEERPTPGTVGAVARASGRTLTPASTLRPVGSNPLPSTKGSPGGAGAICFEGTREGMRRAGRPVVFKARRELLHAEP